jgi:hypothetical protein
MISIIVLSVILFGIGFILNKNNAKYLLSGYNTMSEEEKSNFNLDEYLVFFRKFHLILSTSLLLVATVLHFWINSIWSSIFLLLFPLCSYTFFIWKSSIYYNKISKNRKIITFGGVAFMSTITLIIVINLSKTLEDNQIFNHSNSIEITGEYGIKISKDKIKLIKLVASYPEISHRSNGFSIGYVKKGKFITNKNTEVKLLINSQKTPLILIVTKDNREIYYSSKNKSNQEIYEEMNSMLKIIQKPK